ncbi:MAG TPA: Ku protein [Actinomycetota bacterium]|nr:Ku protein [Actinomycetota bacterium]
MPPAVWTGSISFGLVNIPVKLYVATASKDVRFHQFERETGRKIRYRRVATGPEPAIPDDETGGIPAPSTEASPPSRQTVEASRDEPTPDPEVSWENVVKGYEIEPGRVITLSSEELRQLEPERSRVLDVEQFVDLHDIDPVFFEKTYYVVPQFREGAERPYSLLLRAMQNSNKVAIGRFTLRTKEYLAAVRPAEQVLMLETLFYADEIRDVKDVWTPRTEEPRERELRLAQQLIEALEGRWDPSGYRDAYRERVLRLLDSKSEKAFVVHEQPEEVPGPRLTDLMDALKESVDAVRVARAKKGKPKNRTG